MGNIVIARPVSSSRNKDFNSVLPEPIHDSQTIKKRKLVAKEEALEPHDKQAASVDSLPGTIQSENVDRSITYKDNDTTLEFDHTEGQLRREGMADCEFECSQITKFLYVGGQRVAENLELLKEKNITRIVNCASAVSPNFHEGYSDIKYLTMNLVDGRQEDISWFVCAVINFIFEGTNRGEKTLIHCERGISRSCSFAIAYRMWSTGEKWKPAFEYVQQRRKICSPNTAFMCNLIEIGEILHGSSSEATLLFRCAYHAAYDTGTPVLKLCRNLNSRRILVPATSLLNPQGVYILRCIKAGRHYLYLWQGELAKPSTADIAESLALKMFRVFSSAANVIKIKQGDEPEEFLSFLLKDGTHHKTDDASANYSDFYDKAFGSNSNSPIPPEAERQVTDILMGFGATSLGVRSPSPDVEKSNVKNALSITLPPLIIENSTNREDVIKQSQANSRSTSRERSSRRPSNSGESSLKRKDSDPPSIALPMTLSRTNSYRTEDGQQVSRQQMVTRINNIISNVANESNPNKPKDRLEIPFALPKESPSRQLQQPLNMKSLNLTKAEPPSPSEEVQPPFFGRSSSKTKVAPLSEALAEVARPNSSERRLFGSSPRVVPFTPSDIQSSSTPNKVKCPVDRLDISPDMKPFFPPDVKQHFPPLLKKDAKGLPLPLNSRMNISDGTAVGPNSTSIQYPEISRSREESLSSDRKLELTIGTTSTTPKPLQKPLLYRAKKLFNPNSTPTMYEWESMGVYDDEDLEETEIFLLLCPNMQHHLWIGNNFDFEIAGITVDDDGKPIMSRLLKWAAKVNIGEVIDKSYVSSGLLNNEVAIHMSGEESDDFWSSFNEGF